MPAPYGPVLTPPARVVMSARTCDGAGHEGTISDAVRNARMGSCIRIECSAMRDVFSEYGRDVEA